MKSVYPSPPFLKYILILNKVIFLYFFSFNKILLLLTWISCFKEKTWFLFYCMVYICCCNKSFSFELKHSFVFKKMCTYFMNHTIVKKTLRLATKHVMWNSFLHTAFDMRRNVTVGEKIPSVFWGDLEKYMWGLLIREGIPGRDRSIDL